MYGELRSDTLYKQGSHHTLCLLPAVRDASYKPAGPQIASYLLGSTGPGGLGGDPVSKSLGFALSVCMGCVNACTNERSSSEWEDENFSLAWMAFV